jgi:hypothetical protein|tara:strand:- start:1508 stop:1762 length:255 start_codon:yes stop_codon:yes gene_type:complete
MTDVKKYNEFFEKYVETGEIFKKKFRMLKHEPGVGRVVVDVEILDVLDGPENDPRDYATVVGLHDWEVGMPLVNFFNNIVKEAA